MNILQEADKLVNGDRNKDYGGVKEDFDRIAQMWSAIFGIDITGDQVPLAMIAVKMSRQANKNKRDNIVDIAGYAHTLEKYHEESECCGDWYSNGECREECIKTNEN